MALEITRLTDTIGATVTGADFRHLAPSDAQRLRRALDDHLVLVCPNQPLDDAEQVRFSEHFGPVERTISANPAGGTPFARQSNIDIETGKLIPAEDRRMDYQRGNMQWHTDSTFKPRRSLCSILSAREVPRTGGATEFASTRAAFESLSAARRADLEALRVRHDLIHSRRRVGFEFTAAERAETPPVEHPLVLTNPTTGRKSVLIGAHAAAIVGWPEDEGERLLEELLALSTRPEHCYRHEWSNHDLVIWDNRATLHRATPYDHRRERRLMQRTTISDPDASD